MNTLIWVLSTLFIVGGVIFLSYSISDTIKTVRRADNLKMTSHMKPNDKAFVEYLLKTNYNAILSEEDEQKH